MEWLPLKRRIRRKEYTVLPNDPPVRVGYLPRRRCRIWHVITLRRLLFCLVFTPFLVLFAILCQGIPPSYENVRVYERRLPQHTVAALTRVDDRPARYLRFPGHLWGHGLNNILQETLLMSYLAFVSNVSFVFEDYTWSHIPLPWTVYDFALRPTRIPLNAILSGPTAGGPMRGPLAVSAEFYERICSGPGATPYILSSAHAPNDADGTELIVYWQSQLAHVDAQCIEIDSSTHDLFDRFFFGGPRILSVLDALAASPILADFMWSPLVHAALARNVALLQPRSAHDLFASFLPTSAGVGNATHTTLPGLVALHLRRGDYARHCPNLAKWGALYMGINQHPSLPDRFDPGPLVDTALNRTDELEAYYRAHCLPRTTEVVARLRDVKRRHASLHLQRVFILTNAWSWSLGEVRDALLADGWTDVASSGDVVLDGEQYYVGMAVDMAIAERAAVFVGNGFSSLSSNVVMLRLAKGMDSTTNHFL